MRFLKNKIRLAREAHEKIEKSLKKEAMKTQQENTNKEIKEDFIKVKLREKRKIVKVNHDVFYWIPKKKSGKGKKGRKGSYCQQISPTKNIIINYGRAIATFVTSKLALPYLQTYIDDGSMILKEFIDFINEEKVKIGGIQGLRSLLLVEDKDEPKIAIFKRVFKSLSEIFIKYFSVNWIIHGKVTHKLTYLKYRSKILRRVQNPEYFTYVRRSVPKGTS